MTAHLAVLSRNGLVLKLVSDYAHGLGCASEAISEPEGNGIRIAMSNDDVGLVDLLTQVALGCAKAGVEVNEPLCLVTSRGAGASSQVRVALRMGRFNIESAVGGAAR